MSVRMGSEPLGRAKGGHIATEAAELAFAVQAHTVAYYRSSIMHDACGYKARIYGMQNRTDERSARENGVVQATG
jgi:hypothetical protein